MTNLPKLGVSTSEIKEAGLGLFTLQKIPKNQVIGWYAGEYVPSWEDETQNSKRVLYDSLGAPSYIFDIK